MFKDYVAKELHILFELLVICCNIGKASHTLQLAKTLKLINIRL